MTTLWERGLGLTGILVISMHVTIGDIRMIDNSSKLFGFQAINI
jgi:hypothetical protein